jgi:hypothetical protein
MLRLLAAFVFDHAGGGRQTRAEARAAASFLRRSKAALLFSGHTAIEYNSRPPQFSSNRCSGLVAFDYFHGQPWPIEVNVLFAAHSVQS